jgi:hypothetical protein
MDIKKSRFSEIKKKMRKLTAVKDKPIKEKPTKEKTAKKSNKKQKITQTVKVNVNTSTSTQPSQGQPYQLPNSFNTDNFKNLQNTIIELLKKNNNPNITERFNISTNTQIPNRSMETQTINPNRSMETQTANIPKPSMETQTIDLSSRDIGNFPQTFKSNKTEDNTIKQNQKNSFTIPSMFIPEKPLNFTEIITSKPELFKPLNPPENIQFSNKEPIRLVEPTKKIESNIIEKFSEKILNPPLYIPPTKKDKNNFSLLDNVFGYEGEAMPSYNTSTIPKDYLNVKIKEENSKIKKETEDVLNEIINKALDKIKNTNEINEIKKKAEQNISDVINKSIKKRTILQNQKNAEEYIKNIVENPLTEQELKNNSIVLKQNELIKKRKMKDLEDEKNNLEKEYNTKLNNDLDKKRLMEEEKKKKKEDKKRLIREEVKRLKDEENLRIGNLQNEARKKMEDDKQSGKDKAFSVLLSNSTPDQQNIFRSSYDNGFLTIPRIRELLLNVRIDPNNDRSKKKFTRAEISSLFNNK